MNSDNVNRDHDATLIVFLGLLVLGVLALSAGLILHYERRVMYGIAIGCIPTGALGAVLSVYVSRWAARKHPDWVQKKRNAMDERSVLIRHHAGYAAFWALFAYVCLYTVLSPTQLLQGVSHAAFGIVTIYVMTVVYWTAVFVYSRKY
jgi:hypothetical protein